MIALTWRLPVVMGQTELNGGDGYALTARVVRAHSARARSASRPLFFSPPQLLLKPQE